MLYNRSASPRGWAQRRQPVANATSRSTGSSTQALVIGASTMPTQLKGHWRRESAALGRGASKQSQVQDNSYASVARRSSDPKHPTTLGMASLLVRKAAEGPQSVRTPVFSAYYKHTPHHFHHGRPQPTWGGRGQPTASATTTQAAAGHQRPAAAS